MGLRPSDTVERQRPFAIVLGCSDSRVPAELVFDQGLGELFVVRVAGNIASRSQIGSIEYATQAFGTSLVVVLGHSGCGAVQAAVDDVRAAIARHSTNLSRIIDFIRPSVEEMQEPDIGDDALVELAVRANVIRSVGLLSRGSAILKALVDSGRLSIVGAEYSLVTGEVEFFDVPEEE